MPSEVSLYSYEHFLSEEDNSVHHSMLAIDINAAVVIGYCIDSLYRRFGFFYLLVFIVTYISKCNINETIAIALSG
jgi:hypothetical protein